MKVQSQLLRIYFHLKIFPCFFQSSNSYSGKTKKNHLKYNEIINQSVFKINSLSLSIIFYFNGFLLIFFSIPFLTQSKVLTVQMSIILTWNLVLVLMHQTRGFKWRNHELNPSQTRPKHKLLKAKTKAKQSRVKANWMMSICYFESLDWCLLWNHWFYFLFT